MADLLNIGSGLDSIYWVVLIAGALIMVMSFFFDGVLHFGDHDGSIMPVVAVFLAIFGGIGVFALTVMKMTPAGSLGISGLTSTAGAAIFYFGIFRVIKSRESTLSDNPSDIVGKSAEVTLAIRPEQLGQISFATPSGRTSAPARSADGGEIKQGTLVEVVECVGTTYYVKKKNIKSTDAPRGDGDGGEENAHL